VRLKRFLEMRGADGGPWRRLCALPAIWTGLLYDDASLDAAWTLVKDWTAEERQALRDAVPVQALKAPFRAGSLQDIARDVVAISKAGLKARNERSPFCGDESSFLEVVEQVAESGITPAEALLAKYHGDWQGDIDKIFTSEAY
jgi:glutamate--cysteine ligase